MTKKTIRCDLVASESSRQYMWELMSDYTELINEFLRQVSQHPNFDTWQLKGKLPSKEADAIFESLKQNPKFSGMPSRVLKSAQVLVMRIYASWLTLHGRLARQIERKSYWLEVLKSDAELTECCGCDLDRLREVATGILEETQRSIADSESSASNGASPKRKRQRKAKKAKDSASPNLFRVLIEQHRAEKDDLNRGSIAYLLKNGCHLPEKPEDPKRFAKRRRKAEIRVERLKRTFERTRIPQGRNLSWVQWLETLTEATQKVPEDDHEFMNWQANLLKKVHPLPFPVNYETNEDLIWSRNEEGRICVGFSGSSREHLFEIYCNQRQLHWFQRFLEDQQTKRKSKQHSAALFTLRSGRIAWAEDSGEGEPWQANKLTISCAVDTRMWSAEGTAEIRQEKAHDIIKIIKGTKAKGDLSKKQEEFIQRKEKTLALIGNPFPRPSKAQYQGNPKILAGVSYGLDKPATLAIVNVETGKAITYRSIRQLLGEQYKLLRRYRLRQQRHAHRRRVRQSKNASGRIQESNVGEHLDRLIAHSIVSVAREYGVSSIVLPNLTNIREVVEAEVQCRAEQKIPGHKKGQCEYAKAYRASVHRWSYGRLTDNIASQASRFHMSIEQAQQPLQETQQAKAKGLVLLAYNNRNQEITQAG